MSNYDAGAPAEGGEGNGYDRQRSPAPERRGEDEFGREAGGAPGSGSPAGRDGDRERERERSPDDRRRERDASPRRRPPPPPPGRNPRFQQEAPPSNVLGCFGLSIRTRDVDLEDEFARYGKVEKAVVVYDQRSERSRGFGFVTMATEDDAKLCIEKLNGIELHGRNIRVAFSQTQKPHQSTPGEYMGFKTQGGGGGGRRFDDRGPPPRRDDRDRYRRDDRDGGRGFGGRGGGYGGGRDRDYDRDDRDYRRRDDYDDRRRRDDSPPRRRDDRDDRKQD